MRRDFVANASHELRTPLTSIRGFVEALEDGAVEEPATAQRFLGKIRTHADRMAALVEDLLELRRLESGDRAPEWEKALPPRWRTTSSPSFAGLATRKDIALRRVDRGAPSVRTDPERLRRVLENLVDNAVKYTPSGGQVEVATLAGPDGGALIEVADNGPGIAAEHQRPDLRALLPRGQGAQPRARRHRARPVDRQAPGGGHGRLGVGRERAGEGLEVCRHLAGKARLDGLPGRDLRGLPRGLS